MRSRARVRAGRLLATVFTAGLSAGLLMLTTSHSLNAQASRQATHTTLTTETRDVSGRTIVTAALTVASDGDTPAAGAVSLIDHGKPVAGAALNAEGKVTFTVEGLLAGDHSLKAVYNGDPLHQPSSSETSHVVAEAATVTPDFTLAISATTVTVAAPGDAGTLTATVTPNAGTGFTGFLSLSCSGPSVTSGAPGGSALPYGVTCTFSPANLEVTAPTTANPTGAQSANLSIQTTGPAGSTSQIQPLQRPGVQGQGSGKVVALAFLLPGVFGFAFLGRKRGIFGRGVLLVTLAALTMLGASACSPRYSYFHHPPTYNGGTGVGTYTITVTAQTSNGVTATEHSQTLALVIQ